MPYGTLGQERINNTAVYDPLLQQTRHNQEIKKSGNDNYTTEKQTDLETLITLLRVIRRTEEKGVPKTGSIRKKHGHDHNRFPSLAAQETYGSKFCIL